MNKLLHNGTQRRAFKLPRLTVKQHTSSSTIKRSISRPLISCQSKKEGKLTPSFSLVCHTETSNTEAEGLYKIKKQASVSAWGNVRSRLRDYVVEQSYLPEDACASFVLRLLPTYGA